MKRILSLVLVLALIAAMGISTAFAADDGFVDGKFTETRHITVEIYNRNNDGGTDPTNNVWTEYLKKGMLEKYNVEVEYVSVGRWTETDDIAQLMADKQAPDISYTYGANTIISYANMVDENGNPVLSTWLPIWKSTRTTSVTSLPCSAARTTCTMTRIPPPALCG